MPVLTNLKRILFTSGLTKSEYALAAARIEKDNREKLNACLSIAGVLFVVMFILSFFIESISHSRMVYLVGLGGTVGLYLFSLIGKGPGFPTAASYFFADLTFCFGIYQSCITSPEEQTASFMALILAVPFWFGLIPIRIISHIIAFTALFIGCVMHYKTGSVQTADIVNAIIYSSLSIIVSTYATCSKCKRFYAEYLTEQAGKTDPLTSLGNRLAYSEIEAEHEGRPIPANLTVWYLDVNELKIVNDTLGHEAGDELLRGAADCIAEAFAKHGQCYRTGGDEFLVICELDSAKRDELSRKLDKAVNSWKGSFDRPLRISYGCAAAYELPDASFADLANLADSRLHDAKVLYYSTLGIDRRGHEDAYYALCDSYIKVLKVDLSNDTYRVVRANINDGFMSENSTTRFSQGMKDFGMSGYVHPDDVDEYMAKTDLEYIRSHFRSGKRHLHIFYRRNMDNRFHYVMTELMASREYSDEEQIVYLYVKNIDR